MHYFAREARGTELTHILRETLILFSVADQISKDDRLQLRSDEMENFLKMRSVQYRVNST